MSTPMVRNLFREIPDTLPSEHFETLMETGCARIERIVSTGHATPPGLWYDQEHTEWVVLIGGSAGLRFDGEATQTLQPGDYLMIPAHARHRVEWTSEEPPAVWLAVHLRENSQGAESQRTA